MKSSDFFKNASPEDTFYCNVLKSTTILEEFQSILDDTSICSKKRFINKIEETMSALIYCLLEEFRETSYSAQKEAGIFIENNNTVVIKRKYYKNNSSFSIRAGDCGSAYGPKYYCGFYPFRCDCRFNKMYCNDNPTDFFKMFSYDFKLICKTIGVPLFLDSTKRITFFKENAEDLENTKNILWVLSGFNACDSSSLINPRVFSSLEKAEEWLEKYCKSNNIFYYEIDTKNSTKEEHIIFNFIDGDSFWRDYGSITRVILDNPSVEAKNYSVSFGS